MIKQFVKMKTRLNCDLFEAYRSLTRKDKMEKWGAAFMEDGFEIKSESGSLIAQIEAYGDLNESVMPVIWSGKIILNEEGNLAVEQMCKLSFYRMNCTQKTEYCTEVHLMIEPKDETCEEASLNLVGEMILERIRERYNKDWVILDSDLNASVLRGSF